MNFEEIRIAINVAEELEIAHSSLSWAWRAFQSKQLSENLVVIVHEQP